jgi:ubiquinone/menaquinone biosynthesis C-methylase UbiE
MTNWKAYRVDHIVDEYAKAEHLQPAEERILAELEGSLQNTRMLDIGVGGGRSTVHFAPRVKEYMGGDFSPAMVEASRERFGEDANRRFLVLDARDLRQFGDGRFDLVLFSFNGIDEVPSEDRKTVLREIYRVLAPAGSFVFSTHNLQTLPRLYRVSGCGSVLRCLKRLIKVVLLRLINGPPSRYRERSSAVINDGVHRFRLRLHYVAPAFQMQELKDLGYAGIQAFGSDHGAPIGEGSLGDVDDPWVYFLCRKPAT